MMQKKCPYCKQLSFSSYDGGKWICPNCRKDISLVKAVVVENRPIKQERDRDAEGRS